MKCSACSGSGRVQRGDEEVQCQGCEGKGDRCTECENTGLAEIPPGIYVRCPHGCPRAPFWLVHVRQDA